MQSRRRDRQYRSIEEDFLVKRVSSLLSLVLLTLSWSANARAEFQVGAAVIDVTPEELPVLVNGGMTSRSADKVKTRLNARAMVFDDGSERLAIVVVDSCMMPRPLLDEAKSLAAKRTGSGRTGC